MSSNVSPAQGSTVREQIPPAFLFQRDNATWIPQETGVGPWSPDALHGGPVAALCVSVAEELIPGHNWVTTRLSLDLLRPVLARPITVQAAVLKSGRRVQLVQIELIQDQREVALARVQRTSHSAVELPDLVGTGLEPRPLPDRPEDFVPFDPKFAPRPPAPFLRMATDFHTRTPAALYEPGVKVGWIRVYADLLPGVPLSNSAAIAAAADYTNAMGAPIMPAFSPVLFPNADLTVHLVRTPVSKWLRLSPTSTWLEHGIGHTRCELCDEHGMLGTSAVTLPLTRRPSTP